METTTQTLKPVKAPKPRKKSFLVWFAVIMISFGVITLMYPIVGNFLANRERSSAVDVYNEELEKLTEEEKSHQLELANRFNEELFERQQGISNRNDVNYKNLISNEVMGTLEVPALNIKGLPFYHGTSYTVLDKSIGHFESSSIPVGGENTRAVITGHSGMRNQVLFTDIKSLQEGDIFFINILGEKLAYKIESFEEVLPSEVDRVKVIPGKDMVTLLTCTPPGINTYRLLVNGVRIPYEEAEQTPVTRRNVWSYQSLVLISLSVCVALSIVFWILYRHLMKQSNSTYPVLAASAKKRLKILIYVVRGFFVGLIVATLIILGTAAYGFTQVQNEPDFGVTNVGTENDLYAYNAQKMLEGNYDEQQIRSVNIENYTEALEELQTNVNKWGIGKIAIPSVGIQLPILSGLNNHTLLSGVATYTQMQEMGKSNYVLMSHNLVGAHALLNQVNNAPVGQMIYSTDFKDVYTFEITTNEVVEETQVEVLAATQEPIITLIRCEGDIGTIYRRVVQGKLVGKTSINETDSEILKALGIIQLNAPVNGTLMQENPISYMNQFSMNLASSIIGNPLETAIPLVLLLLLPIILLGLI